MDEPWKSEATGGEARKTDKTVRLAKMDCPERQAQPAYIQEFSGDNDVILQSLAQTIAMIIYRSSSQSLQLRQASTQY